MQKHVTLESSLRASLSRIEVELQNLRKSLEVITRMLDVLIGVIVGEEEPLPDEVEAVIREDELVPEDEIRRRLSGGV